VLNFPKQITNLSSSCKIIPFKKKKKHLNWSYGSEDIADLKSIIFRGFSDSHGTAELITFDGVLRSLPNQCHWIKDFTRFRLINYVWCF
jgi:hypothetical protein